MAQKRSISDFYGRARLLSENRARPLLLGANTVLFPPKGLKAVTSVTNLNRHEQMHHQFSSNAKHTNDHVVHWNVWSVFSNAVERVRLWVQCVCSCGPRRGPLAQAGSPIAIALLMPLSLHLAITQAAQY
eukprot:1307779-Amphidinium_carterae.1